MERTTRPTALLFSALLCLVVSLVVAFAVAAGGLTAAFASSATETIATDSLMTEYTGSHFKVYVVNKGDYDGACVDDDWPMTIESLNGEVISSAQFAIGFNEDWVQYATVDKGTMSGNTKGSLSLTVTDVNSSSLTLSCSKEYFQVRSVAVTYEVSGPTPIDIFVVDGTADATSAVAGTTVTITANDAPEGKVFDQWVSDDVEFADAAGVTTTFVMPDVNYDFVRMYATYKDAEKIDPQIVEGADPVVKQGVPERLEFKVNVAPAYLAGVIMDGNPLSKSEEYSVAEDAAGSFIRLDGSYVAGLSAGEHQFVVDTDYGFVATSITVRAKHSVTFENPENGRIEIAASYGYLGSNMAAAVVPNEGYEVESFIVICDGERVDATLYASQDRTRVYTYTMPDGNVKIRATLKKIEGPKIIEGNGAKVTAGSATSLAFRSDAPFSEFVRVEVDGATLDGSKFDIKEGSTVVTLHADYVATLSAGEHTIGIVSQGGTATAKFTVEKAASSQATTSPKTGDAAPVVVLAIGAIAAIGVIVVVRRKLA